MLKEIPGRNLHAFRLPRRRAPPRAFASSAGDAFSLHPPPSRLFLCLLRLFRAEQDSAASRAHPSASAFPTPSKFIAAPNGIMPPGLLPLPAALRPALLRNVVRPAEKRPALRKERVFVMTRKKRYFAAGAFSAGAAALGAAALSAGAVALPGSGSAGFSREGSSPKVAGSASRMAFTASVISTSGA